MNSYSFLLENGNRLDVNATTPEAGLKKILSLPTFTLHEGSRVTATFMRYNNSGFASAYDWKTTDKTRDLIEKHIKK